MAKRKAKRYNEDGYVDTEFGDIEGAIERAKTAKPAAEPSFKDAFAEARAAALKGGPKTFDWNGKKFTTELAGEKKSTPPTVKPSVSSDTSAAPKSEPTKSSGSRVGRAGQSSVSTEPAAPSQANIDAANEKRARQRSEMSDVPIARLFGDLAAKRRERLKREAEEGGWNYAKGGKVSSASKRADGIAVKGKTRGKIY